MQFFCLIWLFSLCCHSTKAFTEIHQSSVFNPTHAHPCHSRPTAFQSHRDVESFLWSPMIRVRYVLNAGRCDYRYVLHSVIGSKRRVCRFARPSSSLVPHALALSPSFASGWKSGRRILSFKEQIHAFTRTSDGGSLLFTAGNKFGLTAVNHVYWEHSKISGPY